LIIVVDFVEICLNQVQVKMAKASKSRASKYKYVIQSQLTIEGFESPFSKTLDAIPLFSEPKITSEANVCKE
jgi:hypothetical protein